MLRFNKLLLAALFCLSVVSFSPKPSSPPAVNYCTYGVSSILDDQAGYIIIQGEEITGQTEGVDYSCSPFPRSICTITTRCETVLQVSSDTYHIPKSGDYTSTRGTYQP